MFGLWIHNYLIMILMLTLQLFTIVVTYLSLLLKFALALGSASVIEQVFECPCMNTTTMVPWSHFYLCITCSTFGFYYIIYVVNKLYKFTSSCSISLFATIRFPRTTFKRAKLLAINWSKKPCEDPLLMEINDIQAVYLEFIGTFFGIIYINRDPCLLISPETLRAN